MSMSCIFIIECNDKTKLKLHMYYTAELKCLQFQI